ncbi:MAG: HigA family addiction module antitoxin [Sphaerochaeta sp.]|jgi:addiction module HigA family antidote
MDNNKENSDSKYLGPLSIGEFLTEEFLKPLNISTYRLAKDIRVPVSRIQEILKDKRAISIDTGLRLSHYFGMSEDFFVKLQAKVSFEKERIKVLKEIKHLPTWEELKRSQSNR